MARDMTITLDRPRVLRLDLWSQMQFEKAAGKPVGEMSESATDLATIVWACLIHEDPDLTIDGLAKMIDLDKLEEISGVIEELMGSGESPLSETDSPVGLPADMTSA